MTEAETSNEMSMGRIRVAARARAYPRERMLALAHHIDEDALERSFRRLRRKAAVGVDGVTKDMYGDALEENLKELWTRLKGMKYRHQPIRRVHIPKSNGKTRLIGVSTTEDKTVQGALTELLVDLYEPVFLPCSFGFRPGRSPHDALKAFNQAVARGDANFVLEIDIAAFFDSIDRAMLREMMSRRIGDKSLMRLVGKCLHVGILDGDEFARPEMGATQGSSLSPLLGNVYLHYVLDEWFEAEVKPRLGGRSVFIRFADDVLMGFERQEDAQRVSRVVEKRLAKFNLKLAPDKTRLLDYRKPPKDQQSGKGPGTFDFLGFTHYWKRSRKGMWHSAWKTQSAKRQRFAKTIGDYCRKNRHEPLKVQHAALTSRIRGHFNYYGVNGNLNMLKIQQREFQRIWLKWLKRRSQRSRLTWERFQDLLNAYPLPKAKIYRNLWATP